MNPPETPTPPEPQHAPTDEDREVAYKIADPSGDFPLTEDPGQVGHDEAQDGYDFNERMVQEVDRIAPIIATHRAAACAKAVEEACRPLVEALEGIKNREEAITTAGKTFLDQS